MDYLSSVQLDIMLFLGGACGILAVMTLLARSLPRRTKHILAAMETSAMLLLFIDRFSYKFNGDPSRLGYVMTRVCNGLGYFFVLFIPFLLTRYLVDLFLTEGKLKEKPRLLKICDYLFAVGFVLLLIGPFTRMYYWIDEGNVYHRGSFHLVCYVVPFLMVILQETTIVIHRKSLPRRFVYSLFISISLPIFATVAQIFLYGLSLTTITMAFVMIVFYTFALKYISDLVQRSKERELASTREAQIREAELFGETTEALANAIDAKDKYTSGHSSRVAYYSRLIASEANLPKKTCDEVYFAALLHDVGKIGVDRDILNKVGRLTPDEFEQIKEHPILGDQILSSIKNAPFLSIGARHHHEKYDGTGYPDGLAGEEIPEIARIIAVADAYDAMSSRRSYRDPLEKNVIRRELEKGKGTQFDPKFAEIMLRLMDEEERNNAAS